MFQINSFTLLRRLTNSFRTKSSRPFSAQQLVVSKKKRESLSISKKPARPPFMKNVFLGIFDSEMLLYPELDKTSLHELKTNIKPIEDVVTKSVDPLAVSSLRMIPNEAKEKLKSLGLFGQNIPSQYGGIDQTATETALISEITAKDLNLALTLYSHNFLAAQSLIMFGSEEQKAKYLPQLASGEKIGALCLSEQVSSSDLNNFTTKLVKSEDSDMFILNGEKKWVTNASNAGLFIVAAKYDILSHTAQTIPMIRLVIIDRESPGVSVSPPMEHVGLNASDICEVQFKNTPVSNDCLIGDEMKGFEMCTKLINCGRYNIGAITLSVLKTLLKRGTDFINSRKQFNTSLSDCEMIHSKLSDIAQCIYILESMTYHTASLLDNYEDADCLMEQAIIKIFSFTEGRKCLDLLLELLGGHAYLNSEVTQQYFTDFRTMEVFDGTTDIANLFVSLIGLQHAGTAMNEDVVKLRMPYQYPNFVIKYIFKNTMRNSDNPRLTLKLFEQLHPSLKESANNLEHCVLRFEYAVKMLFSRYGPDIMYQQIELKRLANTAVKIYAMTCVLGRASRSYCIGLGNAETELKYAMAVCYNYRRIVQSELSDAIDGFIVSGDVNPLCQGPDILQKHGYYIEHPLERSY